MDAEDIKWWENYPKSSLPLYSFYFDSYQPITRKEADLLDKFWVVTDEGYQLAVCWIAIKGPDTTGVEGWFVRRGEVIPIKGYNGVIEPIDKEKASLYEQILSEDRSGKEGHLK